MKTTTSPSEYIIVGTHEEFVFAMRDLPAGAKARNINRPELALGLNPTPGCKLIILPTADRDTVMELHHRGFK